LLTQLTAALFRETNPAPLKYALSLLGLMSTKVRLPLVEPTQETRREIKAALARLDEGYSDYMVASVPRQQEEVRAAAR
jgi:dihydrodipicolinate synthase/N-acetylneuraminate lyase